MNIDGVLYYDDAILELKIENNLWGYYNYKTHELISIEECRLAKTSINNVIKYKEYIKIYNGSITIRSNYNDAINYKCDKVKNILNKFASITNNIEIIKNDIPLNYRNKIELKI